MGVAPAPAEVADDAKELEFLDGIALVDPLIEEGGDGEARVSNRANSGIEVVVTGPI